MGRRATNFVKINPHKCVACWKCLPACPKGVIGKVDLWFHKHIVFKHSDACIGCYKCIKACPHDVYSKVTDG
ncbi:MAG: 4Fe-4S binding protein [Barnesiella sp.]|nr:4Fe-4S binding protein [Barnesiella sp.]MBD5258862.1 4Fe-4S binding protein [Barnesiella sp.]